jgi:hypothetical protein
MGKYKKHGKSGGFEDKFAGGLAGTVDEWIDVKNKRISRK